jgi:hypothetical protein
MNLPASKDMKKRYLGTTFFVAVIILFPGLLFAQIDTLQEIIRAEIMKDARSQEIGPVDLDAMVAALAEAARSEGITAQDITWQPAQAVSTEYESATEREASCNFLCQVNRIFGFAGNTYIIPLMLGVTSGIIILIVGSMLHRHHKHSIEPTIESIHTHQ